ncbi:MAG: VTT domain-containing protein [Elusimicrobia bacterium]|nr:VTT domain-containing protein [Elusimicrobiota bacterium]
MIGHLTQWILDALRTNGGWSVFIGVLIEQIIIPIPSPAIIMGAGFILIPGETSWADAIAIASLQIVLPGVIASILGAIGIYYLGRYGGKVFVDRFEKFIGFSWTDVESIGSHFTRRGEEISLFLLRAVPIVPLSLISVASGVLELPIGLFVVWSALGTIVRCYLLAILGWQMGGKALELAQGVNRFESLISVLMAGGVVAGILYMRHRVRKNLAAKKN